MFFTKIITADDDIQWSRKLIQHRINIVVYKIRTNHQVVSHKDISLDALITSR